MARRNRVNKNAVQIKEVQGPQKPTVHGNHKEPDKGLVQVQADLTEKYLGTGMIGLQASLQVLSNIGGDDLLCQHGYELYRRMQQDPEIDSGINTLVQGACAQPIQVVSPLRSTEDGYKRSQKYVDFINWTFEQFDVDQWCREQLRTALVYGNATSEADWDYVERGRWAGKFTIKELRLQFPENFGYIVDRWGEIYGVAPLNQAAGTLFPLGNLIPLSANGLATNLSAAVPRFKLTIWTWEKQGTDPRGKSILIPAYIPWWSKQRAIEEWSCWIGRYGQPSIIATPGQDAVNICVELSNGQQQITSPTTALLNVLKDFKNASALALPFGSTVKLLEATGGAGPFIESIQMFNVEISRALLGQHLATGEGQNQSRSAAEVHALVLRQVINSLRYYKAKQIKRDLIRPIIELNFGDVGELLPIVDLGDGDGSPPTITDVAVLLQSGYFTTDQLSKLDRILGFPIRETTEPAGPQAISNQGKKDATADTLSVQPRRSRSS